MLGYEKISHNIYLDSFDSHGMTVPFTMKEYDDIKNLLNDDWIIDPIKVNGYSISIYPKYTPNEDLDIVVNKVADEWYLTRYYEHSNKKLQSEMEFQYHKCDQFHGLSNYIKDKLNETKIRGLY